MTTIYKICERMEWEEAEAGGRFTGSPADSRDGFIHFSTAAQLLGTAAKHFAGLSDLMLVAVDVVLGPCVTLLIANPRKPRSELVRDVGVIVLVQLAALVYGTTALWHGRPLFYAFSTDRVELVQAQDIDAGETALARKQNPAFVPHWYSLPRWIWAPLPADSKVAAEIMRSAITGGNVVLYRVGSSGRAIEPWIPLTRSEAWDLAADLMAAGAGVDDTGRPAGERQAKSIRKRA